LSSAVRLTLARPKISRRDDAKIAAPADDGRAAAAYRLRESTSIRRRKP
jgi:hypothetical protein